MSNQLLEVAQQIARASSRLKGGWNGTGPGSIIDHRSSPSPLVVWSLAAVPIIKFASTLHLGWDWVRSQPRHEIAGAFDWAERPRTRMQEG